MAKRSIRVTLSNNTPYPLNLLGSAVLCGGKWTEGGWNPPAQIQPKTHGAWQSQSDGILTGTEGWVKYLIEQSDKRCFVQLVYIHWNNPFVWDKNTTPFDFEVSNTDITPPCGDTGKAVWGVTSPGRNQIQDCQNELFPAGVVGSGPTGIDGIDIGWYTALSLWDKLPQLLLINQESINLEFTLGLRQKGSVDQTIFSFYDGKGGLRAITDAAKQPSFRKLFRM
jgi:hypothetical protein